jgi:dihydrofolate reductase
MIAVAAVDLLGGIGNEGKLLCHLPGDLKHFRHLTERKTVILGRKTLETFPEQKPLPNRENVILTHDENFECENAVVCHSIKEVLEHCAEKNPEDVVVIGGGSVYEQFSSYITKFYLTRIYELFPADTWLRIHGEWKVTEESQLYEENGTSYQYLTYERINK